MANTRVLSKKLEQFGNNADGGAAACVLRKWIGAVVSVVVMLALWVAVDSPVAQAAPLDCNAAPGWIVSSEAELNAAINCYNASTSPGSYTITLDQDIASTGSFVSGQHTASFQFILQSAPGYALTIDGAGFRASGSGGPTVAGFGVAVGNAGSTVTFFDLRVTGGHPAILARSGEVTILFSNLWVNTHGLGIGADATVMVTDSAIANSNGFGILNRGKVTVYNSIVSGNSTGIYNIGSLIVSHSSVIDNTAAAITTSKGAAILNSTINGSWNGIETYGGNTVISNSTIDTGALRVAAGTTSIRSSIVTWCSPGIIDLGNNLGGCFDPVWRPVILDLADNGCVTSTPLGCVRTRDLLDRSEPTGVCDGVPVLDLATNTVARGTLTTDQRGVPRTPAGAGCDVGAIEGSLAPRCPATAATTVVANEAELVEALECFNRSSVPGMHTIALAADITVTGTYDAAVLDAIILHLIFLQSSTPPIQQRNEGISLHIDGGGHTVTGTSTHDVFLVLSGSPILFSDISVTGGLGAIVLASEGGGPTANKLTVRDSALIGNYFGIKGYVASGVPDIRVSNSLVANNTVGIDTVGWEFGHQTSLIVTGSSIVDNGTGIFTSLAQLVVSNSTLHGNSTGILAYKHSEVAVSNSTITGGDSVSFGDGGGVIVSSIVEQCGGATDGGGNVGGCFGTATADLGPLADNGCVTPNPAGCNPTRALLPGSAGSGIGICSGVVVVDPITLEISTSDLTFDQRGVARTPVGVGCDAGAFEQ